MNNGLATFTFTIIFVQSLKKKRQKQKNIKPLEDVVSEEGWEGSSGLQGQTDLRLHPESSCSISIFFFLLQKKRTENQTDLMKTVQSSSRLTLPNHGEARDRSAFRNTWIQGLRPYQIFLSLSAFHPLSLLSHRLPALLPLVGFILSGQLFPQVQSIAKCSDKSIFFKPQG